jgi:hypothetical protein
MSHWNSPDVGGRDLAIGELSAFDKMGQRTKMAATNSQMAEAN